MPGCPFYTDIKVLVLLGRYCNGGLPFILESSIIDLGITEGGKQTADEQPDV